MSKRGATQQLSKEGNFFGDGSNELSGDDKPRQATAAQLAKRKLKPLKGRPRVAGSQSSSQSFPPAAQQQPASNAFGGFSPAPPSGGFNFSAGPPSNPFASQNAANDNNTGSNAFSSSFTFGSNPSGASNPFGSIASASPANNAFGNTESAGAPSSNLFGSSSPAPSNNLFGGNNASSAPSSNLFSTSSTQQNAFASKPPDSSNNAFANNSSGSSNMFGTKPSAPSGNIFVSAASSAPNNSLFGASTSSAAASNLFGTAGSSSPSTNLFASSTSAKKSDATSQPQTGNVFGSTTSSGPPANTFSGTAMSSAPSNNLFGSATSSAPSTNLFGNSTSSTPSTSAFGGATSSAPSNVFGSTPASSAPSNPFSSSTTSVAPSSNMFGKSATSSAPAPAFFGASTSNTSSAPANALNAPSAAPANNLFANPTPPSGSGEPASQTANLFAQSAADSTPPSSSFNFGGQAGANTSSASSEQSTSAMSGSQQSSTSNIFSQSSAFQPSTSGAGIFNFSAQSPAKTAADAAPSTDSSKDASASVDSQAKPAANIFPQSTSGTAPKVGSNLFGSTSESPSKASSTATSQTGMNLFNFLGQSTPSNVDAQKDGQKSTETQPSSTSNLFAKAASGGANGSSTFESLGQTASPKQDKAAELTPSSNPFSSITSSSSVTGSAAPTLKINGAPSDQESSNVENGSPAKPNISSVQAPESTSTAPATPNFDMSKINMKHVEMALKVRSLNRWIKMKVSSTPVDGDFAAIAQVYLKFFAKHTSAVFDAGSSAQAQTKSSGKRKADDESEAGSPKKSKVSSGQDDSSSAGALNTANVFNSLVNKPAQSPLRNVESATSPDAEAGPSTNSNLFGAFSSPFKLNASGGTAGSTTPVGSPAKPSGFSQSPIKAPVFGQVGTAEQSPNAKRRSEDISSDEQEEDSQDETTQKEKRQKTSTPVSSADTGSVLNSRQASPDVRNPFGHLSREESNKDGDDEDASDEEEAAEQGSTTPTATPKRIDGLFGRITKDATASDGDPKTPEDGGIFGRITGTSTDNSKPAAANPFGFPASSYELPGGAKTGPVLKTWNGDAASPIKFGTSQPAPSDDGNKEATSSSASSNPFSGIATGNSSAGGPIFKFTPAPAPPAGDSSPFKFNPPAATPSGTSSVFASGFGSRATTPGVSTGASENETSAAENDDDDEAQTVDNEQVALRTALTDEDKKTYEVLFDTDIQPVTLMHLVDRTEDEIKAEPKKGAKKWENQGKGPIRVLKHKESGGVSILFKAEPMGRVLINTRVQPSFHYKKAKAKFATFPLPDEKGKITAQYLKFEGDAECTKFVDVCESNKSS